MLGIKTVFRNLNVYGPWPEYGKYFSILQIFSERQISQSISYRLISLKLTFQYLICHDQANGTHLEHLRHEKCSIVIRKSFSEKYIKNENISSRKTVYS